MKLSGVLLASEKPKELVEFYTKALDRKPDWTGQEGQFQGWNVGGEMLAIGPHDQIHGSSKEPARVMYNFEVDDVKKEFERVKTTGAKVVQEPYHPGEDSAMTMATFADPDGNYFQLNSPM